MITKSAEARIETLLLKLGKTSDLQPIFIVLSNLFFSLYL